MQCFQRSCCVYRGIQPTPLGLYGLRILPRPNHHNQSEKIHQENSSWYLSVKGHKISYLALLLWDIIKKLENNSSCLLMRNKDFILKQVLSRPIREQFKDLNLRPSECMYSAPAIMPAKHVSLPKTSSCSSQVQLLMSIFLYLDKRYPASSTCRKL